MIRKGCPVTCGAQEISSMHAVPDAAVSSSWSLQGLLYLSKGASCMHAQIMHEQHVAALGRASFICMHSTLR